MLRCHRLAVLRAASQPVRWTSKKIAVLRGDGVGPDVTDAAVGVLQTIATRLSHDFELTTYDFGGCAIDNVGDPLPPATLEGCRAADAVLMGSIGGPKWGPSAPVRPEEGLLRLRQELQLYCNLRPIKVMNPALSPVRDVEGTDIMFVRELTGGIYFGPRREVDSEGLSFDTELYTVEEVERIARAAGELARSRRNLVTQVDKANVLATSRMWREVTDRIFRDEFPDVRLEHRLVDSAAMQLVTDPTGFDVVLTNNLFGDILTDQASTLPGSLGLSPSASLSASSTLAKGFGLYEPIHGSAPDIAGTGRANPIGAILSAAMLLRHSFGMEAEAAAVERAVYTVVMQGAACDDMMGKGRRVKPLGTKEMQRKIEEQLQSTLGRRPMTLAEKLLCNNAIGLQTPEVSPGDMICVKVDWTLASEITWKGMEKTYQLMGEPDFWRNDRFWLALDHTVDPRVNHLPKPQELIAASEAIAEKQNIKDFYPSNTTILHTEFYRQRIQPGMVIVGADSHTCSGGALGAFVVGLGAADVVMPLVTGETWIQVPETVRINFVGELEFGIVGKDLILWTMAKLKRNTVAFERVVEYTGNLSALSCDSRFAIANMTTEFGGITGVFEGDAITQGFLQKRKEPEHKTNAKYFRADPDAQYAESHDINLSEVAPMVALFPSPDNGVHIDEVVGKPLDGCFIGACTTAEEELILAGLVLKAGLALGLKPTTTGQRRVTPGSVPITQRLEELGLLDAYTEAGFIIGAPGCSYCLGIAADKAGEGEVWLSSQNRNFENRMGKGSIANLASAATVAASSFDMKVTDPRPLLDKIDRVAYEQMLQQRPSRVPVPIVEPTPELAAQGDAVEVVPPAPLNKVIRSRVQRFGDHIDTDAIIPAEFMPGKDDQDLGLHAFEYVRPEFRQRVADGQTVVVGGVGFGSGSSREEAPRSLLGSGVEAVIARSYAYIYSRNQPNMALLGITLKDEEFYELAQEGVDIEVDVPAREVRVGGRTFPFNLSVIEERLLAGGGVTDMYHSYGDKLFRAAVAP